MKIKLAATHQGLMGIEKNADEKELEMKGIFPSGIWADELKTMDSLCWLS
ncbi:hypothetical protein [Lederbergia galactosidilytica]|nr:hypothetical protein [Lederbergia galactosidilytica]